MSKRIVVIGGSGKLGSVVIRYLLDADYDVLNADRQPPPGTPDYPTVIVDARDGAQVYDVLAGADAVVHLAAIPVAAGPPGNVIFRDNTLMTYNVLEAASNYGIPRVVCMSTMAVIYYPPPVWYPFEPHYLPVDEEHPPTHRNAYSLGFSKKIIIPRCSRRIAKSGEFRGSGLGFGNPSRAGWDNLNSGTPLSKQVGELTAEMFGRLGRTVPVSLRPAWIVSPGEIRAKGLLDPENLEDGLYGLWSYIDVRDVARACQAALEADLTRHEVFNLSAPDAFASIPTVDLVKMLWPALTDLRGDLSGHRPLIDCRKAARLLGFEAVYSVRNQPS